MKNSKIVIGLVAASILSLPALAQTNDSNNNSNVSNSLIDVNKVKRDAVKHDQLSTDVSLLKLELERAQLSQQIAEANSAISSLSNEAVLESQTSELRTEFQALQDEKEKVISGLQERIKQLESKKVIQAKKEIELKPLEKIFVTSIRGIGNNLTAQFYVDNDVMYRRKGENINSDVFIENITSNGALLRTSKESKFLSVTTLKQAYHKVKKVPMMNQEKFDKRENEKRR